MSQNPNLEALLPHIRQNVGFVFTDEDLTDIRDRIVSNKVPAAARAGAIAPVSCTVPAQVTPLGPEKTSFFQALQIPTKISRGNIEILVGLILYYLCLHEIHVLLTFSLGYFRVRWNSSRPG